MAASLHSPTHSNPSTTPPTSASPPSLPPSPIRSQPLDDIFASSSSSSSPSSPSLPITSSNPPQHLLSDLPALRRQHVTAGYREGLSLAKTKTIQEGFDDGYENGVALGLRLGVIRGVLEGVAVAAGKMRREEVEEEEQEQKGGARKVLQRFERQVEGVEGFLKGVDDEEIGRRGGEVRWNTEAVERLEAWEGNVSGRLGGGEEG